MTLQLNVSLKRAEFTLRANLAIPGSGVTVLFGPSGCGKSSMLRVIAGLESQASGSVTFADQVWQSGSCFEPPHRRRIGYVFQQPGLLPHLTVRGNLDFGWKRSASPIAEDKRQAILALLGLDRFLERKPHQLSGGEQQRVAIARALFVNPQLLLMDEPLSALDDALKDEIMPFLENLHQEVQIPVIYVSHSTREVARLADYLVLMDYGSISRHGPALDLLADPHSPLSARKDASVVISASVIKHDADYHLNHLEFEGGELYVSGDAIPVGSQVRVQIHAKDVSLTVPQPTQTSILNVLPASVEDIIDEPGAQVMVTLKVGSARIFSRITRRSLDGLALSKGMNVFAQVKSVALV